MSDNANSTIEAPPPKAKVKVKPRHQSCPAEPKQLPPYHVILLDDDQHTYEYVIEMLGKVCGYAVERAFQMAKDVDQDGRVIVMTTHKERAELKRDQIQGYGRDVRMAISIGSMRAIIQPAEG